MEKILVIDDQSYVVDMISFIVSAAGYTPEKAIGGVEGLEKARAFNPDLILCDVMMPEVSGYDVLREIRKDPELSATPFIFLTARADHSDVREGMELGADDYLVKPFNEAELLRAIKTRLEKHESVQGRFEQKINLLRQGLSTILPHELRTPLTLILAHSSLVLESYDDMGKEGVLESTRAIYQSGERLHRIMENLLMYVELQNDETLPLENPQPADAAGLIGDAATLLARVHGRTADLNLDLASGEARIHAFHLRKVAEELIDNAFKFSRKGKLVAVSSQLGDGGLSLTVTDQGRGLSAEEVSKADVYVQFHRDRFEQQGMGIGLTLVDRIAKLYDGTVQIEGGPESGTRVTVAFRNV